MEFDKSKVITAINIEEFEEGSLGWISDNVEYLKRRIIEKDPYRVFRQPSEDFPFVSKHLSSSRYFYPAPKQAIPVFEVGDIVEVVVDGFFIKKGTSGTIIRCSDDHPTIDFKSGNDIYTVLKETCKLVPFQFKRPRPKVGDVVELLSSHKKDKLARIESIEEDKEGWFTIRYKLCSNGESCKLLTCFPMKTLRVVNSSYRPFKNAEEFKPFRDEWFVTTFPNGEQSHFKVIDYCDTGIVSVGGYSTDSRAKLSFCTYAGMFKWVIRENGEPCGIKEKV
nr:hypothetical protein [uncultured Sphaerochaeta sp.]